MAYPFLAVMTIALYQSVGIPNGTRFSTFFQRACITGSLNWKGTGIELCLALEIAPSLRWKVAHRRYWVRLECRMFGIGANRWILTWIWWHDLFLGGTRWANQLVYLHRQGTQRDQRGICPSLFVEMVIPGLESWWWVPVVGLGQ